MSRLFEPNFIIEVFGPEAAKGLQEQIVVSKNLQEYVDRTFNKVQGSLLFRNIFSAAQSLEPVHRTVDMLDPEYPMVTSFMTGTIIALGGLWQHTNLNQRKVIATVPLVSELLVDKDDEHEAIHNRAAQLRLLGKTGYEYATNYNAMFELIEDDISPDGMYTTAAKDGFGLPFLMVAEAAQRDHRKAEVGRVEDFGRLADAKNEEDAKKLEDLKNLAILASGDNFDWDALLR